MRLTAIDDPNAHIPVLPTEVARLLAVCPGDVVVDATVGLGGHSRLLAEAAGPAGRLIGLDVDPANLAIARARLRDISCPITLREANFARLRDVLAVEGVGSVDVLLADLGVSSTQLDEADRGFSFRYDAPLDMRMDPTLPQTAADLVNRLKEKELGNVLFFNAQEMAARKIARGICEARRESRITTTGRLVEVICNTLHVDPLSRRSKIHPATRTFLALRMEVNDEKGALASLLDAAPHVLKPGGRFGVISFHSVEDKLVKLDFRRRKSDGIYDIITSKPVSAEPEERERNPRSRSAKLRVIRRRPMDDTV